MLVYGLGSVIAAQEMAFHALLPSGSESAGSCVSEVVFTAGLVVPGK